jgi:beta-lactamase regulating signal transducer with metallopeptidase domain
MQLLTGTGLAITGDLLIRVSLVLAAGLVLAQSGRKHPAFCHAILVAALATAFIMPTLTLSMHLLTPPRLPLELMGRSVLGDPPRHTESLEHPAPGISTTRRGEARLDPLSAPTLRPEDSPIWPRFLSHLNGPTGSLMAAVLLSTWLVGTIVRAAGLGFSLVRLRRLVKKARPVTDESVIASLRRVGKAIPIRPTPQLLESAEISAPVAVGVIGNYVILPATWAEGLNQDEIASVLCHECAHLARHDHRVVILQEVLASILWFHPLAYLFNRRLSRVREEVCDNFAITLVDRARYCEAILHFAARRAGVSLSLRCATSMCTGRWSLEDRVRGILDERRPTTTTITAAARWALAIVSMASCALISFPRVTASQAADSRTTEVVASASASKSRAASEMTRSLRKLFQVRGEDFVRIENLAGRIEVVTGSGPAVEVSAMIRVSELTRDETERLLNDIAWVQVSAGDGKARWGLALPDGRYATIRYAVTGETPAGGATVNHLGRKVRLSDRPGKAIPALEFDLNIAVPVGARLAIHNAVGPITGRNLDARLQATTHVGAIQLQNVRASLIASSERGPIMISSLNGDATLQTDSGDIELMRVESGRVELRTRSGRCRIASLPEAGFRLQYSGAGRFDFASKGTMRISARDGSRRSEMISRGAGGPSITIASETGDTLIEAGP